MREAVPGKNSSMTSSDRPTASKIWAPMYDDMVLMPILDMVLSRPLPTAFR